MAIKKFLITATTFVIISINTVFAIIPNIEINVSKMASLLSQVHFSNSKLHSKTMDIFAKEIAKISKNSDFTTFVKHFVNNDNNNHYFTDEFISIYKLALLEHENCFETNIDALNETKLQIQNFCNSKFANDFFKGAFKFYKPANIQRDNVFNIYLVISQINENQSLIKRIGDDIILMRHMYIPTIQQVGIILKCVCDTLFENQKTDSLKKADSFFRNHSSRYAYPAYVHLKEVLSVCIGIRWASIKMSNNNNDNFYKKIPASKNKKINKLSEQILPLITQYINSWGYIDENFYNEYIKIVEVVLPNIYKSYDTIFSHVILKTDDEKIRSQISDILKENFDTQVIDHEINYSQKQIPIICINNYIGGIDSKITAKIPKNRKDFLYIAINEDGKIFVFIKSEDQNKIANALDILKKKEVAEDGFTANL